MVMATDKLLKQNKYDGFISWSDQTISNGAWATNVGNQSTYRRPSGVTGTNNFNMILDVAGTYLVLYHVNIAALNTTGLRGVRIYIDESSVGEEFIAPTANGTSCLIGRIVTSTGTTSTRLGVFQSSGSSVTAAEIFVAVIRVD